MKKLLKIVLVSSIPLVLFSCYYDEFVPKEEVVLPPGTEVSFADDITPIFETYDCSRCHNPTGIKPNPNLTPGSEYNSLVPAFVTAGDPDNSKLYTQLAIKEHQDVDDYSIKLIKTWIEQGAENN